MAFGLTSTLLNGMNSDYMAGMAHFMSWSIFMGLGFMFAVAGVFVTLGGVQLDRRAKKAVVAETEDIQRVAPVIGAAAHGAES